MADKTIYIEHICKQMYCIIKWLNTVVPMNTLHISLDALETTWLKVLLKNWRTQFTHFSSTSHFMEKPVVSISEKTTKQSTSLTIPTGLFHSTHTTDTIPSQSFHFMDKIWRSKRWFQHATNYHQYHSHKTYQSSFSKPLEFKRKITILVAITLRVHFHM